MSKKWVLVPYADGEISPMEWMAREFDRLAILRKMWSSAAARPAVHEPEER